MKPLFLLSALALAGTSAATPASAAPAWAKQAPATKVVRYNDLDLASTKGQRRLAWRIRSAVSRICAEDNQPSPAPPLMDPICFEATMTDARQQMDRAIARATDGPVLVAAVRTIPQK